MLIISMFEKIYNCRTDTAHQSSCSFFWTSYIILNSKIDLIRTSHNTSYIILLYFKGTTHQILRNFLVELIFRRLQLSYLIIFQIICKKPKKSMKTTTKSIQWFWILFWTLRQTDNAQWETLYYNNRYRCRFLVEIISKISYLFNTLLHT